MHDRIARVARHVENLQVWPERLRLAAELATVYPGHDHVRQQQIDPFAVLHEDMESGLRIGSRDDAVV